MQDDDRKAKLKENLNRANSLHNLTLSNEYQMVLLPYLKKLATPITIDPSQYKNEDDLNFALRNENARARVYAELISFLSIQEEIINKIRKEIEKPPTSYGV